MVTITKVIDVLNVINLVRNVINSYVANALKVIIYFKTLYANNVIVIA